MDNQRREIAEATLKCIRSRGFHRTSVRDICVTAGVSRGAFYVHFEDKDEAVDAAVESHWGTQTQRPASGTWISFEQALRDWLEKVTERDARLDFAVTFELLAEIAADRAKYPSYEEAQRHTFDHMLNALSDMKNRREINPIGDLGPTARMVMGLLYGAAQNRLTLSGDEIRLDIEEVIESIKRVVGRTSMGNETISPD